MNNITVRKQYGFTLIELLVVVVIIGILAAIAIPQFSAYRQRGFDSRSVSDLRSAATGEEVYYSINETYVDCIGSAACATTLPGFKASAGTVVSMFWQSESSFTGMSYNPKGTKKDQGTAWQWNSANGGLQ